jgi:hypothetical protein
VTPPPSGPARARRGARGRVLGLAVAVAIAALAASAAHATTYLALTPSQMLGKANIVFVGTVSSISVTVRAGRPWTDVSFNVATALEGVPVDGKGNPTGPVQLSFLGGDAAGGPALIVGGMPHFQSGETVLVFAYDQSYASPIVGFRQGLWRVTSAGVVDEDSRPLSVDANGELSAGGPGASLAQIVAAIRHQLAAKAGTP